ncbi:MAG: hypothetical protein AMK70_07995 [Nitrospira bacterium SG8_35_1]|nr:MAG: hypothetical protein AMK70_07995 [Nitrospira bacterium SG8_35_1]
MIQAAGTLPVEALRVTLQAARTRTGLTVLSIVEQLLQELLHLSTAEDCQDHTNQEYSMNFMGIFGSPFFFKHCGLIFVTIRFRETTRETEMPYNRAIFHAVRNQTL